MDRFDRRVVVVAPGEARAYVPGEWRDALVVVEHGAVDWDEVAGFVVDSYRLCAPKSLARAIT